MAETLEALETIDLLYRAALDPQLWPRALQSLSHCAGGVGTAMIRVTPGKKDGLIVSPALEEPNVEYQREWWQHDTRVLRIHSRRLSQGVCCEAQLFTGDELARDPLRQDFLRRYGIGSFAAHLVAPLPDFVVAFSVQRALENGEFHNRELATLDLLGRHAARALAISIRISAATQLENALDAAMGTIACAAFLIDEQLRVVHANAQAERLLGDGLVVREGSLQASRRADQSALHRLLKSAVQASTDVDDLSAVVVLRPSGKRPLLLQAMPISPGTVDACLPKIAALLVAVDPESDEDFSAEAHLRLLGLTPAEARIAALLGNGASRQAVAGQLRLSEHTVSDTIKKIYAKLSIERQGELVRLVAKLGQLKRQP